MSGQQDQLLVRFYTFSQTWSRGGGGQRRGTVLRNDLQFRSMCETVYHMLVSLSVIPAAEYRVGGWRKSLELITLRAS